MGNPAAVKKLKTEKRRKKYEQRLGPGVYLPKAEREQVNAHVAKAVEAAKADKAKRAAAAKAKKAEKDKAKAKPAAKPAAEAK